VRTRAGSARQGAGRIRATMSRNTQAGSVARLRRRTRTHNKSPRRAATGAQVPGVARGCLLAEAPGHNDVGFAAGRTILLRDAVWALYHGHIVALVVAVNRWAACREGRKSRAKSNMNASRYRDAARRIAAEELYTEAQLHAPRRLARRPLAARRHTTAGRV